ncbi:MAG TPA: YjbQ family protein [Deltaproteobacteria bacterium]|nr:YjbQ family protein [Deltaproteobacteria bacterium]
MYYATTIGFSTSGFCDVVNITDEVEAAVEEAGVADGVVTVFVPGSTGSVTTIEFEDGVISDLKEAVERLVPRNMHYDHDRRWGDGNGFSHVRAALLKPGITVPIINGEIALGTWQQIVFLDFDNRPRTREVVVHVMGD